MANTITLFRMAAGIVLLLCPVFSPVFYVLYIAAGLSDMLDGFVARKTDTVSELGARLDTMADFVLVVVCLIKLLPILNIPAWLYGWIGIIALIKVANIISGFAAQKKLVTVHSVMNKATGGVAVYAAADDSRSFAEILCDCRLCGGNVRRNSGRPFHQNRKRIAARAM